MDVWPVPRPEWLPGSRLWPGRPRLADIWEVSWLNGDLLLSLVAAPRPNLPFNLIRSRLSASARGLAHGRATLHAHPWSAGLLSQLLCASMCLAQAGQQTPLLPLLAACSLCRVDLARRGGVSALRQSQLVQAACGPGFDTREEALELTAFLQEVAFPYCPPAHSLARLEALLGLGWLMLCCIPCVTIQVVGAQ